MAVAAQLLIRQAVELLQDQTSIRWSVPDLVRWLNSGQREILMHRPDIYNKTATVQCVVGTKQSLPTDGVKLIDVQRNDATSKRAVRMCNREILDSQIPGWHSLTAKDEVVHFMYDPREPKAFWVYPPATAAAALMVNYSATPTDLIIPADGSDYSAVTGNVSVPDQNANSLLDFILYRAYMKDSEYAGDPQRSQAYYTLFANALGIDIKGTVAVGPTSRGNPNTRPGGAPAAGA